MILLENVTKRYKHKTVLDDVSFSVSGGEFVSLVGPSGAGKTTLIHAIIGAVKINEGRILIDNFNIPSLSSSKIQALRRQIGIVFQDYLLLSQKTVFENVAFALEVCGYPQKFVQTRTLNALKITGLDKIKNSFPHELSGGEKQRTAIARALVHAPELLVADEPTGNLDPDNSIELAKLLLKINQNGTTVLLSTHDKDVVDFLNKRVITIIDGKIISDRKKGGYRHSK